MILFPAIDIMGGRCVRLTRGDLSSPTVYNDDPSDQALKFERLGFEWLHVVDLDAAISGKSVNRDAVDLILARTKLPVQLGGGVRDLEAVEDWLSRGVRRVILGTSAVRSPDFVREACRAFPGRIVVGIDARGGRVATDGWVAVSDIRATDFARKLEGTGVSALVHTDIDRDGSLDGINVEGTLAIARSVSIPVIASGGLSSIDDVRRLLDDDCSILEGAITGRALYDGRLDAQEALALIRKAAC